MAYQPQLFKPIPIVDFPPDSPMIEDPYLHQLKIDTANVMENRLPLSSFEPAYQVQIKDFYRFSATQYNTVPGVVAKRTRDTLDII